MLGHIEYFIASLGVPVRFRCIRYHDQGVPVLVKDSYDRHNPKGTGFNGIHMFLWKIEFSPVKIKNGQSPILLQTCIGQAGEHILENFFLKTVDHREPDRHI